MSIFLITIAVLVLIIAIYKYTFKKEHSIEYIWDNDENRLKLDFLRIFNDNPNLRYLKINFNDFYVQYMLWTETRELYAETISNEYLTNQNKLNTHQVDNLIGIGFILPNAKDEFGNSTLNFSKCYKVKNKSDYINVFHELKYIMVSVYKISNKTKISMKYS